MKYLKNYEAMSGNFAIGSYLHNVIYPRRKYNQLMISISENKFKNFKELIKRINLEEVDSDGNTALLIASGEGRTKMVKELIKAGANIYHKNNKGEDFHDLAKNRYKFINGTLDYIEKIFPEYIAAKKYNL